MFNMKRMITFLMSVLIMGSTVCVPVMAAEATGEEPEVVQEAAAQQEEDSETEGALTELPEDSETEGTLTELPEDPETEGVLTELPEDPETEYVESEVVDDDGRAYEQAEDSEADAAGNAKTVIIHQQTNVIQHGPNNNQITNNGTMVFDFRKGGI